MKKRHGRGKKLSENKAKNFDNKIKEHTRNMFNFLLRKKANNGQLKEFFDELRDKTHKK